MRKVLVTLVFLMGTVALGGCGDDDLALCRDCPTATPAPSTTPTVTGPTATPTPVGP